MPADTDLPSPVPAGAAELHARLLTLDSHIDIPWPNPPDPFGATQRRVDFSKMVAGGMRVGCFAAYVPQGPRTQAGWDDARNRALAMLDSINASAGTRNGLTATVVTGADALAALAGTQAVAVVPCVENGHAIGEDIGVLSQFRDRGARYLTLTHNGHNALADSSDPRRDLDDGPALHGGLSALGRQAVAELNRLGMLVDVSHTSKATMLQAVELSGVPVVATHSCMHALCPVPRNVDDEQLDALRSSGGLVQITAVAHFLRRGGRADVVAVSDYVDHIDHAVKRCGIAHVGISSDFDGGGALRDWADASQSANMTAELMRRGYDESEIAALWGGNFLRLLRQAEAAAAPAP